MRGRGGWRERREEKGEESGERRKEEKGGEERGKFTCLVLTSNLQQPTHGFRVGEFNGKLYKQKQKLYYIVIIVQSVSFLVILLFLCS